MTYVAYEPPKMSQLTKLGGYAPVTRDLLEDSLLAFQAFSSPQMGASIKADPLGPVNKIVSLVQNDRVIKSALVHIPVGATVSVGHDGGSPHVRFWTSAWDELPELSEPPRPSCWYIEVGGRRVLVATEDECRYKPPLRPPIARRLRAYRAMRRTLTDQWRADTDAIAKRLGYHREDNCNGWDE